MNNPTQIQREYYARTAEDYDNLHLKPQEPEHDFALRFLSATLDFYDIKSVLDVGAGTGRAINYL